MAYSEQFTCDVCGAVRQRSNNWFIGRETLTREIIKNSLTILPFGEKEAKMTDYNPKLLCGEACVSKWVSQNLASLHSELKTAAAEPVLASSKISHVEKFKNAIKEASNEELQKLASLKVRVKTEQAE